jgi:hypothetical protein
MPFLDERVQRRDLPLHPTRATPNQLRLTRLEPAELDSTNAFLLLIPRANANRRAIALT